MTNSCLKEVADRSVILLGKSLCCLSEDLRNYEVLGETFAPRGNCFRYVKVTIKGRFVKDFLVDL